MSKVLVVGSVAFDTLHLPSGSHSKVAGGAALYASISGSFFSPMRLVGVVGRDFPEAELNKLKSHNIDLDGLEVADGKTFHWEGRYSTDLDSRETLATDLNVFADFKPNIPGQYKDSPYVMLGNIDPSLQLQVLEQVPKPKLVVADTMNFWIENTLPELKRTLERVDVLVINEEEARQLADRYNLVHAARVLQAMGPQTVVIKQGEYGALLFERNQIFSAPAYPLETVVDPTGAGDSFAGAFIGWIAAQGEIGPNSFRNAVVYGSAAASFCVQGVGPGELLKAKRESIAERYREFAKLVHFATDHELKS